MRACALYKNSKQNKLTNVFLKKDIADNYDSYYQTELGEKIDDIEKEIISELLNEIKEQYTLAKERRH